MRCRGMISILLTFCFGLTYAQSTGKRFVSLPSKQTGITFNNKLKDTKDHNIMMYSNYYGGAGVGVGDFNQDGLPDLFFAGNLEDDELYVNQGNLNFKRVTKSAGIVSDGGWSSGVIVADFNQDNLPDIYVTRELYDDKPELRNNLLYINQGNLKFKEMAAVYGVEDTARTRHATVLDYDKDGDLDLYLLNQPPNPGDYSDYYGTELIKDEYRAKLYRNEGDHFVDVTQEAGLFRTGFPNSVTASDLNGDGWTDLYVANDFWIGDWYYINNGDGTFTDKIQDYARHISFSSMGVDAGDINNDGRLDLIVVDMVAEDNYRLKANMSGMNPEAFWKVVNDGEHYQYMFNMLHLNIGEGYLSDIAQLANVASTDWSWSPLLADFDQDGFKDLFVTNGLMRDIRNKDGAKAFSKYLEKTIYNHIKENPNAGEVSIWEIVDIEEALKLVPSEKLHNYIFRNNGDLTFSKKIVDWGFETETFSSGSAYADLDLDGDLDLIISNVNDQAGIYQNQTVEMGLGNYLIIEPVENQPQITLEGTKIWVTAGGQQQFWEITGVRGMYSTSELMAHFGLGNNEVVDEIKIQWPDGQTFIQTGPIAVNQRLKINYTQATLPPEDAPQQITWMEEVTHELPGEIQHKENTFDDYVTQVLLPHKMSTQGPALAVGDINGDGLDDFFLGAGANKIPSLFLQTPDGYFQEMDCPSLAATKIHEDVDAHFFDSDLDGDLDLYVASGGNEFNPTSGSYQDRLYINDGKGQFTFGENLLPEMIVSSSKVVPADFDQDGDLDLFVAGRHQPWSYPEPTSSFLLLNEGGTFKNVTETVAPMLVNFGMVNDASWFDHNGDGLLDLVLAGEWTPIAILENKGNEFIKVDNNGLDQSTGWWFSVKTADMDQDGDEDIIAGNLGLNYKYKANEREPFEVYYYDFDENGKKDVVLTYYNFGIAYPLRGRQCSSEQVPMLKEKFPNYDLFASSDVFTVYGEDKLSNALHFEANTFATSYIENLGNGQYKISPLPVETQLSSVNDMLIDDYNQDGHLDILMAGNLFNAEVETARNDAGYGMLLTGNGAGVFEPIDRMESGFFVPYNVKHLATLNTANGPVILVASNDDKLRIFRPSGALNK